MFTNTGIYNPGWLVCILVHSCRSFDSSCVINSATCMNRAIALLLASMGGWKWFSNTHKPVVLCICSVTIKAKAFNWCSSVLLPTEGVFWYLLIHSWRNYRSLSIPVCSFMCCALKCAYTHNSPKVIHKKSLIAQRILKCRWIPIKACVNQCGHGSDVDRGKCITYFDIKYP